MKAMTHARFSAWLILTTIGGPALADDRAPAPGPVGVDFHHQVDASIVKTARIHIESDGTQHAVALSRDEKGVTSAFVEDEILVRDDPSELAALVKNYHARVIRQITVNMSKDGKALGSAKIPPLTILQVDPSAIPLDLDQEGLKLKLQGLHTFSSENGAKVAALFAHERAAGHPILLNFLGQGDEVPISSKEQADANGVSDAYQWPEFDHRAWQYALSVGIKKFPIVAVIDGGFWLNSTGVPCGYAYDSLCQTKAGTVGNSDLPRSFIQGDATGGGSLAGGANPNTCTNNAVCVWHGNRSASVALGAINNKTGAAGMGGPVAVPMLIKSGAP